MAFLAHPIRRGAIRHRRPAALAAPALLAATAVCLALARRLRAQQPVAESSLARFARAAARARADFARDGARYGRARLRRQEERRWEMRQHRLATLRAAFLDGPTLSLRPGSLRISFDPRAQTPLGAVGTVMGGLHWSGEDGSRLDAPAGALVPPDWSAIRVPLAGARFRPGRLQRAREWRTAGWTLVLAPGWTLTRQGADWVASPPRR